MTTEPKPVKPFLVASFSVSLIACLAVAATPSLWVSNVFEVKIENAYANFAYTDSSGNTYQAFQWDDHSGLRKVDSSGQELWRVDMPNRYGSCPAPSDDGILVLGYDGARHIRSDGQIQMLPSIPVNSGFSNCVATGTNKVLFTYLDYNYDLNQSKTKIMAFNVSGDQLWEYEIPQSSPEADTTPFSNPVELSNGNVLLIAKIEDHAHGEDNGLYSFIFDDAGNPVSKNRISTSIYGGTVIYSDGVHNVLVVNPWDLGPTLVSLASDGNVEWTKPMPSLLYPRTESCSQPQGGSMVCVTREGSATKDTLHWIDIATGETQFTREMDLGNGGLSYYPAAASLPPIMSTPDGHLLAIENHTPPFAGTFPDLFPLNTAKPLYIRIHVLSANGDPVRSVTLESSLIKMGNGIQNEMWGVQPELVKPGDAAHYARFVDGQLIVSGSTWHYASDSQHATQVWVKAYTVE